MFEMKILIELRIIKFKLNMKKLINPTTYFFEQADQTPTLQLPEIQQFVKKLLNKDTCELCKLPYNIQERIPRILIHCGHTFCTPCLKQFFMKNRVRCPMCLKLVKQLDSLQRLPINHTIFTHLVEKEKLEGKKQSAVKEASKFLFAEFQRVQKEAHRQQHPLKYDDESGLPFCVFHSDRVEHFFCQSHKTFGCRVCIDIGHPKSDCTVVDLYTVDNPSKYQNIMEERIQQSFPGNYESTYAKVEGGAYGSYLNGQTSLKNKAFGFGNILDPALIDDDDDEQDEGLGYEQDHKSA